MKGLRKDEADHSCRTQSFSRAGSSSVEGRGGVNGGVREVFDVGVCKRMLEAICEVQQAQRSMQLQVWLMRAPLLQVPG